MSNSTNPTTAKIEKLIQNVLTKLNLEEPKIQILPTKDPKFGHFSTNVAMILASKSGREKMELASLIAKEISEVDNKKTLEKVVVAPPGFINFFLKESVFEDQLNQLLEERGEFGGNFSSGRVLVEFVSANPTGYLHVGHARNAAIGIILSRLLSFAGFTIVKEYYVNDFGQQTKGLTNSVLERLKELALPNYTPGESLEYRGEDIKECAKALFYEEGAQILDLNQELQNNLIKDFSIKFFLEEAFEDCEKLGCSFDVVSYESSFHNNGQVDEVFQLLKERDEVYQREGAWYLKTADKGDDKDRVLKKSDGTFTYITPDFAYHIDKLNRYQDLEMLINIWGSDHISYNQRLKLGLQSLDQPVEKMRILSFQQVKLIEGGKELKMSKRSGNAITLREFTQMLGVDEVLYFLTSRSINSVIEIKVDSDSKQDLNNPVFAIKYSFARASQILQRAPTQEFHISEFTEERAKNLVRLLLEWPRVVRDVVKTLKPEIICNYALELARSFNSFYSQVWVLGSPKEKELLAIVKAFQLTLGKVMEIIGFEIKQQI